MSILEAFPLSSHRFLYRGGAGTKHQTQHFTIQNQTMFLFPDYRNGAGCAIAFFGYGSPDHNVFVRGYGSRCKSNSVTFPRMVRRGQHIATRSPHSLQPAGAASGTLSLQACLKKQARNSTVVDDFNDFMTVAVGHACSYLSIRGESGGGNFGESWLRISAHPSSAESTDVPTTPDSPPTVAAPRSLAGLAGKLWRKSFLPPGTPGRGS